MRTQRKKCQDMPRLEAAVRQLFASLSKEDANVIWAFDTENQCRNHFFFFNDILYSKKFIFFSLAPVPERITMGRKEQPSVANAYHLVVKLESTG